MVNSVKSASAPKQKYYQISHERNEEMGGTRYINGVLGRKGQYTEALKNAYHQVAKDIGKYGVDHPNTSLAYYQIALVHSDNKQPHHALNILNIAHDSAKKNGGTDNGYNCTYYGLLSSFYCELERYEDALKPAKQALKMFNAEIGESHLGTIQVHSKLGRIYYKLGQKKHQEYDFADARKDYKKSLEHFETSLKNIKLYWPKNRYTRALNEKWIDYVKAQARTLPNPPEWLPSGTVQDLLAPFAADTAPQKKVESPAKS